MKRKRGKRKKKKKEKPINLYQNILNKDRQRISIGE